MVFVGLLLLASTAVARDYQAEIAEAQSRAASAAAEVVDLRTSIAPDRSRLIVAEKRAEPTRRQVRATAAHIDATKRELRARRSRATGAVAQIHDEQKHAAEKHDQSVHLDIGLGLAALVTAAIALAWSWFRASAAVAYLTRNPLKKVILAVVGIGLLGLIIGGSLVQPGGSLAVLGGLVLGLSLTLPIAFLLARHSAEVQRGRARAMLGRERMSPTVTQTVAGIFGVLFFIAVIAGLTASEGHSRSVTAQLRSEMTLASAVSPQIKSGEMRAAALREQLAPLQKTVTERRSNLQDAERKLHEAQARLADAKRDQQRWSHALAAAQARERRQLAREEARALRRQEREEREYARAVEKEEREAEDLMVEEEEDEACAPNYRGACLHEGIGDYDCAGGSGNGPNYVSGPVEVVGVDEFGLDADGDGIGCEDE